MSEIPRPLLFLIRHAKSSWHNTSTEDALRPLNPRGQADSLRLATRLGKRLKSPYRVISSPALRALSTAQAIAPESRIISAPELYLADAEQLLSYIRRYAQPGISLCIIAHNPGLEALINHLDPSCPAHFPTAAVACFALAPVLKGAPAECLWWDKPKLHPPYTAGV